MVYHLGRKSYHRMQNLFDKILVNLDFSLHIILMVVS